MGVLQRIVEAYRQPLAEATRLTFTPVRDQQVDCPFTGQTRETSECGRCPRYVRTQVVQMVDGFWTETVVACDRARPGPVPGEPLSTN